jgi:hypothetical protein
MNAAITLPAPVLGSWAAGCVVVAGGVAVADTDWDGTLGVGVGLGFEA